MGDAWTRRKNAAVLQAVNEYIIKTALALVRPPTAMRVLTPTPSKRLNEVMGFVFLAGGILLLLSLASYHAQDPSWDTATAHLRPLNLAGPFGAHIADVGLQAFGIAAFLFPLLAFVTGWKWIRSEEINTPVFRLAGFILFLSCFSAAASLFRNVMIFDHMIPIGGVTGEMLADRLRENLNPLGAGIVAVTGMIVSVYLFSAFTLEKLTHWFVPVVSVLQRAVNEFREWRERRHDHALERKEAKREARRLALEADAARASATTARGPLTGNGVGPATQEKRGRKKTF